MEFSPMTHHRTLISATPQPTTTRRSSRRNRVLTLLAVLAVALAPLLGAAPRAAASTTDVCALYCDTLDPSQAQSETFPTPNVDLNGDVIELHVDDVLGMAWGSIDTGQLNDSSWLDRSWDGGSTWDGLLGQAWIPSGWTGTRTLMYNMYDPDDHARAVIRACGDAGGQVACTDWVSSSSATKSYKNAITNALYVRLTAELHVAVSGDTTWLTQADNAWSWFQNSGMINGSGLVNDGLNSSTCANNGGTVWTYNQGMTIGAAVEMYRATGNSGDLSAAEYLADSAISSPLLVTDGVLTESCDALNATCDDDQKQFKGIFMDYLGDLNSVVGGTYTSFIDTQISTLWNSDRDSLNQFGERGSGQTSTADPNIVSWRTQEDYS
jgi:Glycosyl hydrolase family 76